MKRTIMKSIKIKTQNPIIFNSLVQEIQTLPTFALQEILDLVLFIKTRHNDENTELLQVAETALAKDWLRPEEDAAWANL